MLLNRQFLHNGTDTRSLNGINICPCVHTFILSSNFETLVKETKYMAFLFENMAAYKNYKHTDQKQKLNTGSTKTLRRRCIYTYCVEVLYCREAVILSYLSAAEAHKMPVQPAPRL